MNLNMTGSNVKHLPLCALHADKDGSRDTWNVLSMMPSGLRLITRLRYSVVHGIKYRPSAELIQPCILNFGFEKKNLLIFCC